MKKIILSAAVLLSMTAAIVSCDNKDCDSKKECAGKEACDKKDKEACCKEGDSTMMSDSTKKCCKTEEGATEETSTEEHAE